MGLSLPPRRVLINLAPADLLKEGSHFDLPIALGVLAAMDVLPREEIGGFAALGELSLDGSLNPVAGVLPAAIGASRARARADLPRRAGRRGGLGRAHRGAGAAPTCCRLINHFRGTQVLTPARARRDRRSRRAARPGRRERHGNRQAARWRSPPPAATTCC